MNTQELVERAGRRQQEFLRRGITAEVIIADHPDKWREYITKGVFSMRRTSYETAMKRYEKSRQRFGEEHYQRIAIGFAMSFQLYPECMID